MTKEEHDLLAIKEELKRKKQEQVTKKDAAVKEERETVVILFETLDENKDGELQPDEFVNLMHVAGIGGSHASVDDAKKFYMDLGLPLKGQKVVFIF